MVLTKNIIAYYLDRQSNLIVKGGFRAGKLLKVDTQTVVAKRGFNFYLVTNVKHEGIYVHLTKRNCTPLKASSALLESGDENAIKKAMAIVVSKTEVPKSNSDGLCYYEDTAFDYDDGFRFVHDCGIPDKLEQRAIMLKGKLQENKIKNEVAKYNDERRRKLRGTGNGYAFN